jgi:HPt (histidine-containing phosphotransfer) domain-containing protein
MADVVDMSVVHELVDLAGDGDPELLLDLIDMFLDDAPLKVRTIVEAAAAGDLEAVERAAHSLKGSSGNLGAVLLQEVAEQLQIAGRTRTAQSLDELLARLHDESGRAAQALSSLRKQYAPHT